MDFLLVIAVPTLVVLVGAVLVLGAYAVAQLDMVWLFHRHPHPPPTRALPDPLPRVTVQLPVYNELPVVERLLAAVAALRWPRDRLQVQVLDDSTDGTTDVVAAAVARLSTEGLDVQHLRRASRKGFKAGALAHALPQATGELIAVLDADFVPAPDWLEQAVARLGPSDGLVQCRWDHLNRFSSALTRVQAFHLDAHFTLEQHARCFGGLFMGFNGTAGVWRRACIEDAGGWHVDTLTEDLDLAYRAQLAGWRLVYADDVTAPAELPEPMPAVRSQQHRWMKGGAQVARKLLGIVWGADLPLRRRLHGLAHLMGSSLFLAVLALTVVNPLLVSIRGVHPAVDAVLAAAGVGLLLATGGLVAAYLTAYKRRLGLRAGLREVAVGLPLLLLFCTGLSLHNGVAVLEGWLGGVGEFVRTPKDGGGRAVYAVGTSRRAWRVAAGEWALLVWSLAGFAGALALGQWVAAGWLLFQAAAFATIRVVRG